MVLEKICTCFGCWISSSTLEDFIKAYDGCRRGTQNWYSGRTFCRKLSGESCIITGKHGSVIVKQASSLIAWQLWIVHSKLATSRFRDISDVKIIPESYDIIFFAENLGSFLCKHRDSKCWERGAVMWYLRKVSFTKYPYDTRLIIGCHVVLLCTFLSV